MSHVEIRFGALQWETPAPGVRAKAVVDGAMRFRLVEFTDSYDDSVWCSVGHIGFVVSGRLTFVYDHDEIVLEEGDAFDIEDGTASRHRTRIDPDERATVFLVERSPLAHDDGSSSRR